jgi:hypothetical protein
MKRPDPIVLVLGGLCAAGALAAFLLAVGRGGAREPEPSAARPVESSRPARTASSTIPARPTIPAGTTALSRLAQEEGDAAEPATELRAEALASRDALRALIARLSDPGLDPRLRDRIAFVLGSIADFEAEQALAAELRKGGEPDRLAALILALGLNKKIEEPFDEGPDAPYVVDHASGLRLFVYNAFADEPLVDLIASHLDHESDAVRRAAHRALQATLLFEADVRDLAGEPAMGRVRNAFMERVRTEPVEGLRAAFAQALSEWTALSKDSAERRRTQEALVDAALEPEASTIRLRTQAGLAASTLPPDQRRRLLEAASGGGEPDTRGWAMGVLAAHASKMPEEEREALRRALAAGLEEGDAKVREWAARSLGRVAGSDAALTKALGDPAWHVRAAAARALTGTRDAEAREALSRAAAADVDERVRSAAAQALGR